MTIDRDFYTRRIIPASPKAFATQIHEARQRIVEGLDLTAQEAVESGSQRQDVARQFKGSE